MQNQDSFLNINPTRAAIENTKELFKRYAAKNNNPITDLRSRRHGQ
jgi:hypothetical protein